MNIFFDTEFTGLHQNTTLISFGAVSENCTATFYRELNDYDTSQVDEWIEKNVIDKLVSDQVPVSREQLKLDLEAWLQGFGEEIIMWGDCLPYDWMLFCQLWGGALNVPSYINYIPRDICTLFEAHGIDPDIDRLEFVGLSDKRPLHNAFYDATLIRHCYSKIQSEKDIPDLRKRWLMENMGGRRIDAHQSSYL